MRTASICAAVAAASFLAGYLARVLDQSGSSTVFVLFISLIAGMLGGINTLGED